MFTGLIESAGTIRSVARTGRTAVVAADLGEIAAESEIGDSIAINGVCLTVTSIDGPVAKFDLSAETLDRSNLGRLRPGAPVNIERALKAGDRLAGHIVQGHVDGIATFAAIDNSGDYADIRFTAGADLLDQMIVKGSVAVDGISLTVSSIDDSGFSVAVIPETWRNTTLGAAKIGDSANIETDIVVKTVLNRLDKILPRKQSLTTESLRQMGF